jgi:putative transcriptional regulator
MKKQTKLVARRIKELRLKKELSQDGLATLAGIDRKTINRIENGHFSPSLDTFLRICRALSIKPTQLLEGIKV